MTLPSLRPGKIYISNSSYHPQIGDFIAIDNEGMDMRLRIF